MFNPFQRDFLEIDESDLQVLIKNELTEGLYVEFKQSFPSTSKVAKGIAALANTHGGWFIVGVEARHDGVALGLPGHDPATDASAFVRNACRDHLSPFPAYTLRVVGLGNGRLVSVIRVPPGEDGPHIHRDGRVYMRKADSSDPVHLSDKHAMDRLYETKDRADVAFERFAKDRRAHVFSERAWLNIYLAPRPAHAIAFVLKDDLEDYVRLLDVLNQATEIDVFTEAFGKDLRAAIPFNRVYRSGSFLCFEQQAKDVSIVDSLTLSVDDDGRCAVHIPFNKFDLEQAEVGLKSSKVKNMLRSAAGKEGAVAHYYDAADLWLVATQLLSSYKKLIGSGSDGGYRLAVELVNAEWCIPVCDHDNWADACDRVGVPINRRKLLRMPADASRSMTLPPSVDLVKAVRWSVFDLVGIPYDVMALGLARVLRRDEQAQPG